MQGVDLLAQKSDLTEGIGLLPLGLLHLSLGLVGSHLSSICLGLRLYCFFLRLLCPDLRLGCFFLRFLRTGLGLQHEGVAFASPQLCGMVVKQFEVVKKIGRVTKRPQQISLFVCNIKPI